MRNEYTFHPNEDTDYVVEVRFGPNWYPEATFSVKGYDSHFYRVVTVATDEVRISAKLTPKPKPKPEPTTYALHMVGGPRSGDVIASPRYHGTYEFAAVPDIGQAIRSQEAPLYTSIFLTRHVYQTVGAPAYREGTVEHITLHYQRPADG